MGMWLVVGGVGDWRWVVVSHLHIYLYMFGRDTARLQFERDTALARLQDEKDKEVGATEREKPKERQTGRWIGEGEIVCSPVESVWASLSRAFSTRPRDIAHRERGQIDKRVEFVSAY